MKFRIVKDMQCNFCNGWGSTGRSLGEGVLCKKCNGSGYRQVGFIKFYLIRIVTEIESIKKEYVEDRDL